MFMGYSHVYHTFFRKSIWWTDNIYKISNSLGILIHPGYVWDISNHWRGDWNSMVPYLLSTCAKVSS